ncbi:MAG: S1 RNA-binding domain-containing protein [Chloroflexota bacterium]
MSEDVKTTNAPSSIDDLKTGMAVKGTVKRLELYGAFVDIGIGQDALLHISQLGQNKVRNVEDVVNVGQTIDVYVLKVDRKANRVALTMIQPPELGWDEIQEGQTFTGKVIRLENFGIFVDIGAERPGMVHVSELTEGYVKTPSDIVSEGDEVNVRVLKINRKKRQIDLSMREPAETFTAPTEEDDLPTAMELAFRKAQAQADEGDDSEMSTAKQRKNSVKRRSEQQEAILRTLRDTKK